MFVEGDDLVGFLSMKDVLHACAYREGEGAQAMRARGERRWCLFTKKQIDKSTTSKSMNRKLFAFFVRQQLYKIPSQSQP